jgi:hypothetical protein
MNAPTVIRAPTPRKSLSAAAFASISGQGEQLHGFNDDPDTESAIASSVDRMSPNQPGNHMESARPEHIVIPPPAVPAQIDPVPLRPISAPPRLPPADDPIGTTSVIPRSVTPPIVRSPSGGNATPRPTRTGAGQVRTDLQSHVKNFALDSENALRHVRLCVAEHGNATHDDKLRGLFMSYFKNSAVEIEAAIKGTSFKQEADSYDFCHSFILMLMNTKEEHKDELMAAAIIVEKSTKTNKSVVYEIVWFAASNTERSRGLGGLLFANIHYMASCVGVFALVVESTNRAITWWLSRPGVHICSTILRASTRPSLSDVSTRLCPCDVENRKLRGILDGLLNLPSGVDKNVPNSSTNARRCSTPESHCFGSQESGSHSVGGGSRRRPSHGKRRNSSAASVGKGLKKKKTLASHFEVRASPIKAMDILYHDTTFRDSKGNVKNSSKMFQGKPYRYAVDNATHIIFPLCIHLRGSLGINNMLMHVKGPAGTGGNVARVNTPTPCDPRSEKAAQPMVEVEKEKPEKRQGNASVAATLCVMNSDDAANEQVEAMRVVADAMAVTSSDTTPSAANALSDAKDTVTSSSQSNSHDGDDDADTDVGSDGEGE